MTKSPRKRVPRTARTSSAGAQLDTPGVTGDAGDGSAATAADTTGSTNSADTTDAAAADAADTTVPAGADRVQAEGVRPIIGAVTGADVARAAGVSRATVSYAMNDTADARIPEETRRRVRDIARDLGYEPRSDARSLRRGRTDLVVLPTYNVPFGRLLNDFVDGLARELHKLGHTLITYGDSDSRPEAAARAWAALRPAAVVVMPSRLTERSTEYLTARGITVVALSMGADVLPGTSMILDGEIAHAGYVAGRHLVESGRRDIAVIIPREPTVREAGLAFLGRGRLDGVRRAAEEAPHPVRVREIEMHETPEEAAAVVASWGSGDRPDAVFGYNDEYGALLLGALHDAGVRVPEEIALIGTDDLPLCEMVRPRLSSVAFSSTVPLATIAQRIADAVKEPPRTTPAHLSVWRAILRDRDSS
ncbi:LacI family transcriptional regulator [Streptomycetaceae bacterium NBC_01309]